MPGNDAYSCLSGALEGALVQGCRVNDLKLDPALWRRIVEVCGGNVTAGVDFLRYCVRLCTFEINESEPGPSDSDPCEWRSDESGVSLASNVKSSFFSCVERSMSEKLCQPEEQITKDIQIGTLIAVALFLSCAAALMIGYCRSGSAKTGETKPLLESSAGSVEAPAPVNT
ncbi:MAG: hypothetical protein A3C55_03585 [Gammaproteobacteria bacterium RIFCSPHIGHO2_02_FULL_42_13]|nr:MAG: hypothetical protein A3C55_03585 [Gammaproteobacteria bacterium RIFCSPHIGHO2_02_FULL_42_13]OGT70616.1 MAG: hypothetical protein A3H43_05540 [Gammaproteobacteria bacterium RIFCSPLOWO2_02_FULL_42_9]